MSAKTEKETLEVKILVEEDPKVMNFDREKSTLRFDVTNGIPEELKENTSLILKSSTPKQLEALVPFVQKIFDLEKINNIKYDPNDPEESIKLYKETKKNLPKLKEVGEAFKPLIDDFDARLKTIKGMKKHFDDHLRDKYDLLDNNFKEYLDEERKKAEEAKKRKEEKERAEREALIKAQEEANAKIKAQEIERTLLHNESKIKSIVSDATINVANLNIKGIETYRSNLSLINFSSFIEGIDQDSDYSKESIDKLRELFDQSISTASIILTDKINQLEEVQKREKAEREAELLKAQSAQHFQDQKPQNIQPTPQANNSYTNTGDPMNYREEVRPTPNINQMSDYDLLILYNQKSSEYSKEVERLTLNLNNELNQIIGNIQEIALQQHLRALPEKSLPKVNEWMLAIPKWINSAIKQYKEINKL